jgi:hypothetical protein
MTEWWQQPQRIVQTNLRLVDAKLDPEKVASDLAAFGATAMLFNVGGIFGWYPSTLPLQAHNPRLDRDLVGEMIAAAHRHDIRFIGRYDLSKGTRVAYDAHPDWFCVNKQGEPFEYNGTYQACVNGDWYQVQAPKLLEETLSRYEIDGLFFNMFGYLVTDYSFRHYGLCHCDNCKRSFREFSGGHELPDDISNANAVYRTYLRFQDVTSKALKDRIYDVVKSIRPTVGVSNMGARSDFFRGELNRRIDRPRPEWVHQGGEQARNYRSVGRNRIRHSSALTHFIDFPWRYSGETGSAQTLRLAQQLANGADPHYYVMGPLVPQDDRKAMPAVRAIFDHHQRHEALYTGLDSAATLGLYVSEKSRRFDPCGGGVSLKAFRGAYRSLLESGLAFDLVNEDRATAADFAETHARYGCIILSGASCLSDNELGNLDAYVEAGGALLAIGPTGAYDENGDARTRSLSSLPVEIRNDMSFESRGGYLRLGSDRLPNIDSDLVLLDGPYETIAAKPGVESLYRVLMPQPFGPPELCFSEEQPSNLPGAVVGPFSKGHTIYVPFRLDSLYMDYGLAEHRTMLVRLATRFAPQAVAVNRPGRIELTVQRQAGSGALLIHLINYSGQNDNVVDEAIPIHGLELHLSGIGITAAKALVDGGDLEIIGQGERQTVKLPPVGAFEAVAISIAANRRR